MTELTQEIVKELLDCDPELGILTWRYRDRKWFKSDWAWKIWNKKFSGKQAFSTRDESRQRSYGSLFKKRYISYRMIWFWYYGYWPDTIDHINGDFNDNRISNLRDVSIGANQKNLKVSRRNTSGFLGVRFNKKKKKWEAFLNIDKKTTYLGMFSNIEDAKQIVLTARKKYGYHENHGRVE